MAKIITDQKEPSKAQLPQSLLNKFEISALNPMQEEAYKAIQSKSDLVLLSPTGTGKTLAFLLPLIETLDKDCAEIQVLIIVPSRELAQQIEQVTRKMGSGFKVNSVYGGRAGSLDKIDLKHRPAILIGTPGRIADRLRRDNFPLEHIQTLVLDEFDKSLELGFEKEMTEIVGALPNVQQRILTSATNESAIPEFVGLQKPVSINFLEEGASQLVIKTILSPEKDKLNTLKKALTLMDGEPGIVFCNFKDTIDEVSEFLFDNNINHDCFHGGMEQFDRERALIKFRNGTNQLLLATDLAARGLDIPEIKFILHYQLPQSNKEFTHRNGRTARMNSDGIAYILRWQGERIPDFIQEIDPQELSLDDQPSTTLPKAVKWVTVYISGGRRDKISKGDIAGLFLKQGQLQKDQLGVIELQQNCAYAGVHEEAAEMLIEKTNNSKLKKKKVRISLI
ncbi:MAG: superfamily II DNA/RNA helicase [Roseivirga sp.]|jgi:superfamily II DNA/RNA helicase